MQDESTAYIPLRARDGSIRAYAIVDSDDYEWASRFRWHLNNSGYAQRNARVSGRYVSRMLHRELLSATNGQLCDHVNRDRLDNRRANSRFIDRRGNALNSKLKSNNLSGYRGVSYDKAVRFKKFAAQIRTSKGSKTIGRYTTAEAAARAYDCAAIHYHGEFKRLNFPDEE